MRKTYYWNGRRYRYSHTRPYRSRRRPGPNSTRVRRGVYRTRYQRIPLSVMYRSRIWKERNRRFNNFGTLLNFRNIFNRLPDDIRRMVRNLAPCDDNIYWFGRNYVGFKMERYRDNNKSIYD